MQTESRTNNQTTQTDVLETPTTHNNIFEVDIANMRKIHGARDKTFIIREMVQNA
jgi:hypothetical protein